jgi:hypothetical protein
VKAAISVWEVSVKLKLSLCIAMLAVGLSAIVAVATPTAQAKPNKGGNDLLGLVVDLNQVHLQITGQQGPGNLLGNLLCGVAGLLDNGPAGGLTNGLLQGITNLLNQILGQLQL